MRRTDGLSILLLPGMVLFLAAPGCQKTEGVSESHSANTPEPPAGQPGRLSRPLDLPPLEALKDVRWIPQRVADELQILRDRLGREPPPPPEAEALGLRNTDDAANSKIAAALGRLPASDDEVDWDATMVRCLVGEPKTLNYFLNSSGYESFVNSVLYTGPFGFDQDLAHLALADVVAEWSTSEDRMMDRVVLRGDLTWSDGAPFTAHDIEFSYHTIMSPRVPCPAVRNSPENLKGVKAYDDRTVVYFHKQPMATNVWNVNFPIMPRHIYEPTLASDPTMVQSPEHNRRNRDPVSNGPYRFVSWTPGVEIVCERRPEWYEKDGKRIRQKPFFKTIRFRTIQDRNAAMLAFKKGELDELEINADQWHEQTGGADFYARGTKVRAEEWSYYFIAWNQKPIPDAPFFKDRRVREAMSHAFPHREFLEKICHGLYPPAPGMFHPGSWMADPSLKPLQQDLSRAQRLLAEAGWADSDGDGVLDSVVDGKKVPFRFSLSIASGNPIGAGVAALLKESLGKLGVTCDIRELEGTTLFTQALEHKFQATAFAFGTGVDPDTARNLWTTQAYSNGRNYGGYSNPRVDELFELGQREFDRKKRAEIYQEIGRLVAQDFAYTFLFFRSSFYALSKDLRGVNFSPRGPYIYNPGFAAIWKKKRA